MFSTSAGPVAAEDILQQHQYTSVGCLVCCTKPFDGWCTPNIEHDPSTSWRTFYSLRWCNNTDEARCLVARSQQQVTATGKSYFAKPILPPLSLYFLGVWHPAWRTLPDCLAGYFTYLCQNCRMIRRPGHFEHRNIFFAEFSLR